MLPESLNRCRGPGRPRQLDTTEREAIIIDAAEQVILSQGLGGASMAAIAQEAGMSKRTLYEVFESRAALFAAVVRRIRNLVTRPLTESELDLPLAQRLRLLLTPADDKFSDLMPLAILRAVIAEADRQPDLAREFLQEGPHALYGMIRLEIDRSVARGEISISDTESAARLMADMAHENVLEHLVSPRPACERQQAHDRRLDLAIRVFVGGIGEAG
ncbi:MAG: TetR/AcrR family transcriptional regulator [Hoeflea sp.]|uniref:TetR/AcrR family transcriptional regulator n=1 Tax=Hoeflea sp. TaxID=1940281 RepID=UPI00272F3193|nr:TetR/AcrR family transcriptional regulator [Hoeflea sp.]MDP2121287.1 TetR/AcrR family transcriptional regulator [Hoeflea sp.]